MSKQFNEKHTTTILEQNVDDFLLPLGVVIEIDVTIAPMEFITNNYLDRGFQNMLLPFRCLHHLIFISRFSIEYNCIRPHRPSYYIFSFIGVLFFVIFHGLKYSNNDFNSIPNQFVHTFMKANVIVLMIPFFMFFILNVLDRDKHVQILLKIQKALRIINYKRYKLVIIWNWFGALRHFIAFFIITAVFRTIEVAEYFYTMIFFDVNITYAISLITLIRDALLSWIAEVDKYSQTNSEDHKDKHNEKMKKLFQAYISLMEAYEIFKKLFGIAVLYQILDTFFHSLLYLQMSIELSRTTFTESSNFSGDNFGTLTIVWVSKNVYFVFLFSLHCEMFYITVSDTNDICSRILGQIQCTDEGRRLCKNVKRYNRSEFSMMTACHIFTIVGRLPQQFASLVVNYTVVLLQFAFLSE